MSDLENKKAEEAPKKRPYNLREKKEKKAAYQVINQTGTGRRVV